MVKVIRAQYDGLREVARVFAHHADLSVALTFQVEGLIDQLQGGAWRGVGAEGFYAEMGEVILPAMRKLEDALQFARDSTLKIIEIMQAAEADAAALFRGLPGGEISYPQQDDDERRKHLIQMLLSTLRFSGMMNSPLPDNFESLSIAELEALLDGNDNAERSREALMKLVLWVLDKVQSSRLEDDFWSLSAEQRYELLSALVWVMEKVGQGEMPNTALLDSLSEPVRGLIATTLLNVIQRLRQAQNDVLIDEEIRHNHLTAHYSGAIFAEWLGNITAYLSIGSMAFFMRSGGGGGTGGRASTRALNADDLGLQGRIDHLDATLTVENGVATIRVDMVVGDITNPFEVIPNAMRLAQANGAHVLRLEGTIANPDLFRAMQFLARRYGGRFGSNSANEWIEITLIGK